MYMSYGYIYSGSYSQASNFFRETVDLSTLSSSKART